MNYASSLAVDSTRENQLLHEGVAIVQHVKEPHEAGGVRQFQEERMAPQNLRISQLRVVASILRQRDASNAGLSGSVCSLCHPYNRVRLQQQRTAPFLRVLELELRLVWNQCNATTRQRL